MKRHTDALSISRGACNIPGISRALTAAVDECRDSGINPGRDFAVKLILHQLVFLCGEVMTCDDYSAWEWDCKNQCPVERSKAEITAQVGITLAMSGYLAGSLYDTIPSFKIQLGQADHRVEGIISVHTNFLRVEATACLRVNEVWDRTIYGFCGAPRVEMHARLSELVARLTEATGLVTYVSCCNDPGLF